jgi:serine/threonine protein kinase
MDLLKITKGKYNFVNAKNENVSSVNGGAFSKIYDICLLNNKIGAAKKKNIPATHIIKLHPYKYKKEAINEIEVLLELKRNKKEFKKELNTLLSTQNYFTPGMLKSKLVNIKDYYLDHDYLCVVLKKYDITLDSFNIKYNKMFKELLPITLLKKIINSLFLGLYELHYSKFIHCDIKPNNILINLTKYKNIDELLKDVQTKKLKKEDIYKYIDIKIIDFNKTQLSKSIYKSVNIQTLYYTPPEIILGNRNYNYSVDIWAMMNIIYELTTSSFLFDVLNENDANGPHYINYHNDSDDLDDSMGDSNYSNNSDLSDSESEDETTSNLALLYIYNSLLGKNDYVHGDYKNDYYSNDKLIGYQCLQNVSNKEIKIKHSNTDFSKKLNDLCRNIYLYDINKRISSEDIIKQYLF